MELTGKISKKIIVLFSIIALGCLNRLYFWAHYSKALNWDEGAHSLAGVALARTILHGFNIDFLQKFTANYWAARGSLSYFPYGYNIMATGSYLLFGFNQLSARIPSMFFSLLIIIPVYLLAKKMFGKEVGYLSAFMAAINPYFICWGGEALVDLPMACLISYSIYFCLQGIETGRIKYWALSGLFCGFAGLMKPPGFIVFPFLMFMIAYYKGFKHLFKKPVIILTSIVSILAFSYFGLGLLAASVLPKLKIISQETGTLIFKAVFHWFGSAFTYAENQDPSYRTLAGWGYYLKLLPAQLGGYLALSLAFIGASRLKQNKEPGSRKQFYLMVLYILFIYLLSTFLKNKDRRYTMPYLPFFCILTAIGIQWLATTIKQKGMLFITPIILILLTISSFNQSTRLVNLMAGRINLPIAAKVITSLKPGLVVPYPETNEINVQNISFYIAINDPHLEYSVYWPEKLKQADYIISKKEINIANMKSIFSEEELHVYKKN